VRELAGLWGGFLLIFGIVFGIFLSILWILLPFAVFGIKRRLDCVILLLEEQNKKSGKMVVEEALVHSQPRKDLRKKRVAYEKSSRKEVR